ncbi:MAG: hypothetical protein IT372_37495 [Polyangiaceae bacterium]|nr:hypothetical protein [Polyangiaceae bacterium]
MAAEDLEGFDEVMQRVLDSLTPEERLAGLRPDQRLAGIGPEEAMLAMPDEMLRRLPDELLAQIETVRDALRRRQGR